MFLRPRLYFPIAGHTTIGYGVMYCLRSGGSWAESKALPRSADVRLVDREPSLPRRSGSWRLRSNGIGPPPAQKGDPEAV